MGRFVTVVVIILLVTLLWLNQRPAINLDEQIPAQQMATFADNMQVTNSGIHYRIVKKGTGRSPQTTDKVMVNYRGFFKDGRVFDSSYRVKKPAVFQVNSVIKGWTEILLQMQEGGLWEVIIPSHLAYGSAGAGRIIPPDSDLCFQIEFLKIYK